MLRFFGAPLLCIFLCSCVTNYNKQCKDLEFTLKYDKDYSFKNAKVSSMNYLLLNQEAGLYYFLKNDLNKSVDHFNKTIVSYNQFTENKTLKISKNVTSVVISDSLTQYNGSDFEKALVHYYLGLSYLQQNNLNKSLVEFRAGEDTLKFAQESRQKKIISEENYINKMLSQNNLSSDDLDNILQQSKYIRASNQSKFLNANILYVAGIVKELNKQYNHALVNYKQAYTTQPNNTFLIKDLYRLSLQYDIDYANHLVKLYPELAKNNFTNYTKKRTIYVIYEQGFIPKKENLKIPMSMNDLIFSINLPIYNTEIVPNKVNISIPETNNANVIAEDICNIYKLAYNELLKNYPSIIAKQLTKLSVQIIGQKALQSNNITKNYSMIFGALYLLDSSDLRSWYTLPNNVKIAKIDTEKGFNKILLTVNKTHYNLDVSVDKDNIVLLYVFDSGEKLYTKVIYKGKK